MPARPGRIAIIAATKLVIIDEVQIAGIAVVVFLEAAAALQP